MTTIHPFLGSPTVPVEPPTLGERRVSKLSLDQLSQDAGRRGKVLVWKG